MNYDFSAHVGLPAPSFYTESTRGEVRFPEQFSGKWVLLYMYIGDFLPCCATDVLALNAALPRLRSYGAEALALSPDTVAAHIAWIFSLRAQNGGRDLELELASDRSLAILNNYGVNVVATDLDHMEKALMIVDPDGVLETVQLYPHDIGINVTELERELLALQSARSQYAITPEGWTPGEELLDYPPQTLESAETNVSDKTATGGRCVDWYLCFRPDSGKRDKNTP